MLDVVGDVEDPIVTVDGEPVTVDGEPLTVDSYGGGGYGGDGWADDLSSETGPGDRGANRR